MAKHIDRRMNAARPADTAAAIASRRIYAAVLVQLEQERVLRPAVTAENVREELAWQEARIRQLSIERGL